MQVKIRHYQSDGKIPAIAIPQIGFAMVGIVAISAVQAWLNTSVSVLLWPLFFLLHGIAWYYLGRKLIERAHTRNPPLLSVLFLLLSMLDFWLLSVLEKGEWLSIAEGGQQIGAGFPWMASVADWFSLQTNQQPPELVLSKLVSIDISLSTIRLIEWLLLLIAVGWLLVSRYRSMVYCHDCQNWAAQESSVLAFYQLDEPEFEHHISAANLDFLDNAEPILTEPFQDYYQIEANVCESCNNFFAVSVDKYSKASDIDKGKPKRLSNKMLISRAAYQHLLFEKSKFPVPDCSRKLTAGE